MWPRAESVLALAWLRPATAWANDGDIEIVGGLLGVVVLLGHDAVFVERLGAVPIELLLFQVGLRVLDIGLGGLFRGDVGGNVGLGGGDGSLLAVDGGFLLHVLNGGDNLALGYFVAFLHIEVGDPAHGRCADVDIILGLDLAGAADDRGEILADDFCGKNLGVAGLLTLTP